MEEQTALLAKSEKGKIRLDYLEKGSRRTALWEPVYDGVIETIFDGDGVVLRQLFFKGKENAKTQPEEFIKERKIAAKEGQFSDVRLIGKKCPTCGAESIARLAESAGDSTRAPIAPIYTCTACGKKCYYLSDEYLDYLVTHNRFLFEEQELRELDSNKEKFMSELKEYIIRIFASQKIMRIKQV